MDALLPHPRQAGLTGAKQMCDRGACGSCTVIMDGRAILSCMTLAIECDGKTIETVEGIAPPKHPLIEEYVKNHCMQCGYCTPGFVVTAKALLDKNVDPTEEEIREELAGNLCRCGTYPQHPKAVLEAAGNCAPPRKDRHGTDERIMPVNPMEHDKYIPENFRSWGNGGCGASTAQTKGERQGGLHKGRHPARHAPHEILHLALSRTRA